jgi:hypothetical protein
MRYIEVSYVNIFTWEISDEKKGWCKMPRKGYRSLVIPESLYKQIKKRVEDSEGRYVSVSEVVREAVWNLLSNNTTHT